MFMEAVSICCSFGTCGFLTPKHFQRQFTFYFDRAGITSMSAVAHFGTSRHLALGPEKKPVIAVISTHHRTGTVLFQSMGERLCETFLIDYERVDEPFKLSDPNATRTLLYQRYWNTTGRIAVGMHGFEEHCELGQDVGMYCDPLDYECWLSACISIDQKSEVIHLKIEWCMRYSPAAMLGHLLLLVFSLFLRSVPKVFLYAFFKSCDL